MFVPKKQPFLLIKRCAEQYRYFLQQHVCVKKHKAGNSDEQKENEDWSVHPERAFAFSR